MELYDDTQEKKKSKLSTIITISIIILILITILIIYLIIYLRSTITTITLDDADASELEDVFYIEENTKNLYIPIRKIASYFKYEDYSGDYKYKSEDQSKCYVTNKEETVMFTLDSNVIVKTRGNSDYEYIEIDEKVFEREGELYTTIKGIEETFNVEFEYNPEKNTIAIYTLDYLIQNYTTRLGIQNYSTEFSDKKAIFENMLIIKSNNQYGVINAMTGQPILETKYDSIAYLPNTTDFLIKTNEKYGIISKEAEIKIKTVYDSIKIMDNANGLYLVSQNNLYGVLNTEGEVIIGPQYEQIGINIEGYAQNGIESQYIILDELIPVKNNNLWALFNIKGDQITEFEYNGLGCSSSKVANTYPVLVIPSYKIIIVNKNNLYNLMKVDGEEIIDGYVLDSIYMKTDITTGKNTYYMTANGRTENLEERLQQLGIE